MNSFVGIYMCFISVVTNLIALSAKTSYDRIPGVDLFNKSAILISAKISNDLTIGFTQAQDNYTENTMYKILIGGWTNTKSIIR